VLLFGDAPKEPGGGEAVVDGAPFLGDLGVGRGDGERPRLEFERRSDTVEGLHARRGHVLPVGVEVDEAGGDHHPPGVERLLPPSGVAEMAAIFPARTPTQRTASSPVSGSTARPLAMTRS
jgi:hypothetical protein